MEENFQSTKFTSKFCRDHFSGLDMHYTLQFFSKIGNKAFNIAAMLINVLFLVFYNNNWSALKQTGGKTSRASALVQWTLERSGHWSGGYFTLFSFLTSDKVRRAFVLQVLLKI